MKDAYMELAQSAFGKSLFGSLNLPSPPALKRDTSAYPALPFGDETIELDGVRDARYRLLINGALKEAGARVSSASDPTPLRIVFDASGAADPQALKPMYTFLQARLKQLRSNAHIVVVGRDPASCENAAEAATAGTLSGFIKSLGKEIGRKGATVNLLTVADGAEDGIGGALRFLLSGHSAFITGQVLPLTKPPRGLQAGSFEQSLAGKTALVTGAARGIGASIAQTLAREGATVIGMDHPSSEGALAETMAALGGRGLAMDVTAANAGERIIQEIGALDIVIHNAGITRDKLLRNMPEHFWDQVLDVNLGAILRINERLLKGGLKAQARMVCISSIGGIAGNTGQTNYGATKAGIVKYVAALAPKLAEQGGAINAVAPGFIETQMTAAVPPATRFFGRRMSALLQGGSPQDIAEAVMFFASAPLSAGVNGATLRVCGQNWLGA